MAKRKMNSAQVAKKAGFHKSRMSGWSDGGSVTPKLARDTALALGAPVLDAFVAAGYLSPEDAAATVVERPISAMANEEIVHEVLNRMRGARHGVEAPTESSTSTEVHQDQEALVDDAEARRLAALDAAAAEVLDELGVEHGAQSKDE